MTIDFDQTHSKNEATLELPAPLETDPDNPVIWELTITSTSNHGDGLIQPTPSYAYIFRSICVGMFIHFYIQSSITIIVC